MGRDSYLYYYNGGSEGRAFPGEAMQSEGDGWYVLKIYGYTKMNVIFSDKGESQYPRQNKAGIEILNEIWYYKGQLSSTKPEDYKCSLLLCSLFFILNILNDFRGALKLEGIDAWFVIVL